MFHSSYADENKRKPLLHRAFKSMDRDTKAATRRAFHSDRGSQYTSKDFNELCRIHAITQSMSRKGACWDNAVVEAFFGTLKNELIDVYSWPTRARQERDLQLRQRLLQREKIAFIA
jgi:transposase InsO family protein